MAREKMVTRTIITGYKYDVLRKNGESMEIVGSITVDATIRSSKEEKKILKANDFQETDLLVKTGIDQKKFEMSESDFIQHATIVKED